MILVTGAYEGVLAKRFIVDPLVVQVFTLQSPRARFPSLVSSQTLRILLASGTRFIYYI